MNNIADIEELHGSLEISDDDTKWYAVYTKSRHEKKVARKCINNDISYYLPLQESVRHYKNRVVTFMKPLFSGYIFCRCNEDKKRELYQTGHICKFIEPLDQAQFLNDLQQIRGVREKGFKLFLHSYLKRGRRVKVIRGPFKNFQGIISHRKGKYKLVLNINLIRQAIAVEVDINDVDFVE